MQRVSSKRSLQSINSPSKPINDNIGKQQQALSCYKQQHTSKKQKVVHQDSCIRNLQTVSEDKQFNELPYQSQNVVSTSKTQNTQPGIVMQIYPCDDDACKTSSQFGSVAVDNKSQQQQQNIGVVNNQKKQQQYKQISSHGTNHLKCNQNNIKPSITGGPLQNEVSINTLEPRYYRRSKNIKEHTVRKLRFEQQLNSEPNGNLNNDKQQLFYSQQLQNQSSKNNPQSVQQFFKFQQQNDKLKQLDKKEKKDNQVQKLSVQQLFASQANDLLKNQKKLLNTKWGRQNIGSYIARGTGNDRQQDNMFLSPSQNLAVSSHYETTDDCIIGDDSIQKGKPEPGSQVQQTGINCDPTTQSQTITTMIIEGSQDRQIIAEQHKQPDQITNVPQLLSSNSLVDSAHNQISQIPCTQQKGDIQINEKYNSTIPTVEKQPRTIRDLLLNAQSPSRQYQQNLLDRDILFIKDKKEFTSAQKSQSTGKLIYIDQQADSSKNENKNKFPDTDDALNMVYDVTNLNDKSRGRASYVFANSGQQRIFNEIKQAEYERIQLDQKQKQQDNQYCKRLAQFNKQQQLFKQQRQNTLSIIGKQQQLQSQQQNNQNLVNQQMNQKQNELPQQPLKLVENVIEQSQQTQEAHDQHQFPHQKQQYQKYLPQSGVDIGMQQTQLAEKICGSTKQVDNSTGQIIAQTNQIIEQQQQPRDQGPGQSSMSQDMSHDIVCTQDRYDQYVHTEAYIMTTVLIGIEPNLQDPEIPIVVELINQIMQICKPCTPTYVIFKLQENLKQWGITQHDTSDIDKVNIAIGRYVKFKFQNQEFDVDQIDNVIVVIQSIYSYWIRVVEKNGREMEKDQLYTKQINNCTSTVLRSQQQLKAFKDNEEKNWKTLNHKQRKKLVADFNITLHNVPLQDLGEDSKSVFSGKNLGDFITYQQIQPNYPIIHQRDGVLRQTHKYKLVCSACSKWQTDEDLSRMESSKSLKSPSQIYQHLKSDGHLQSTQNISNALKHISSHILSCNMNPSDIINYIQDLSDVIVDKSFNLCSQCNNRKNGGLQTSTPQTSTPYSKVANSVNMETSNVRCYLDSTEKSNEYETFRGLVQGANNSWRPFYVKTYDVQSAIKGRKNIKFLFESCEKYSWYVDKKLNSVFGDVQHQYYINIGLEIQQDCNGFMLIKIINNYIDGQYFQFSIEKFKYCVEQKWYQFDFKMQLASILCQQLNQQQLKQLVKSIPLFFKDGQVFRSPFCNRSRQVNGQCLPCSWTYQQVIRNQQVNGDQLGLQILATNETYARNSYKIRKINRIVQGQPIQRAHSLQQQNVQQQDNNNIALPLSLQPSQTYQNNNRAISEQGDQIMVLENEQSYQLQQNPSFNVTDQQDEGQISGGSSMIKYHNFSGGSINSNCLNQDPVVQKRHFNYVRNNICKLKRYQYRKLKLFPKSYDLVRVLANNKKLNHDNKLVTNQFKRRQFCNIKKVSDVTNYIRKMDKSSHPIYEIVDLILHCEKKQILNTNDQLIQLIRDSLNGRLHKKYSERLKLFYNILMQIGGSSVSQNLSDMLKGPSYRVLQKNRRKVRRDISIGIALLKQSVVIQEALDTYHSIKAVDNDTLYIIGEDSTSLQQRLDAFCKTVDGGKHQIFVSGICGNQQQIINLEHAKKLAQESDLAKYIHLYCLIPINSPAPPIPVGIYFHEGSNKTYNSQIVNKHWDVFINACIINDIKINGFSSDGASQNRNAFYNKSIVEKYLQFNEVVPGLSNNDEFQQYAQQLYSMYQELPQLVQFPYIVSNNQISVYIDFIHLMWRLRLPMIDPMKNLQIGSEFTVAAQQLWSYFKSNDKDFINITATDLDYHDKQNNASCYKLFMFNKDKQGKFTVNQQYRQALQQNSSECWGLYMYSDMVHRFLSMYLIEGLSDRQVIRNASYVISFLAYWYMIQNCLTENCSNEVKQQYSLKKSFISKETMQDLISTCNSIIYTISYQQHFKRPPIQIDRLSTRHNENMFSFMRRYCKTNNYLTALNSCQYISLYDIQLKASLCFPELTKSNSRRQTNTTYMDRRSNLDTQQSQLSMDDIKQEIQSGFLEAKDMLYTNVTISKSSNIVHNAFSDINHHDQLQIANSITDPIGIQQLFSQFTENSTFESVYEEQQDLRSFLIGQAKLQVRQDDFIDITTQLNTLNNSTIISLDGTQSIIQQRKKKIQISQGQKGRHIRNPSQLTHNSTSDKIISIQSGDNNQQSDSEVDQDIQVLPQNDLLRSQMEKVNSCKQKIQQMEIGLENTSDQQIRVQNSHQLLMLKKIYRFEKTLLKSYIDSALHIFEDEGQTQTEQNQDEVAQDATQIQQCDDLDQLQNELNLITRGFDKGKVKFYKPSELTDKRHDEQQSRRVGTLRKLPKQDYSKYTRSNIQNDPSTREQNQIDNYVQTVNNFILNRAKNDYEISCIVKQQTNIQNCLINIINNQNNGEQLRDKDQTNQTNIYKDMIQQVQQYNKVFVQRNSKYKKQIMHKLLKFVDQGTYFVNILDKKKELIQVDDIVSVLVEDMGQQKFTAIIGRIEKMWINWGNRQDVTYTVDASTKRVEFQLRIYDKTKTQTIQGKRKQLIRPSYGLNKEKFQNFKRENIFFKFHTAQTQYIDDINQDELMIDINELSQQYKSLEANNKKLQEEIKQQLNNKHGIQTAFDKIKLVRVKQSERELVVEQA